MFEIKYENGKEIIICGNKNCKSINCIVRYDDYDEWDNDDSLQEFYLCLDCG